MMNSHYINRRGFLRITALTAAAAGLAACGVTSTSSTASKNVDATKPTSNLARTEAPKATALPAATTAKVEKPVPESSNMLLTLAPGVILDLVRIPAGEFLMGSTDADSQAASNEKPQHKVTLDEYLIGKTEVTNAQFGAFVKATGYKTTAEKEGSGYAYDGTNWSDMKGADWQHPKGPNSNISGKDNHPVVLVSWDDAVAFCAWASQVTGRKVTLPTEAQWEKAARGTDGRIYPWGNGEPNANLANFNMNVIDTTEAGKYSPAGDSPYGLSDMAGNAWEWTADWYSDTYYASSPSSNPQGPTTSTGRVLRGGGWINYSLSVRVAFRFRNVPTNRYGHFGFRVAVASAPGS